jgi:hypothetical protein
MKYKIIPFLFLLAFALVKMITKRIAENEKDAKKSHFFKHKKVGFFDTPINTTAEESVATWNELRLFWLNSLKNQKDYQTFQQKQQLSLKNFK